MGRMTTAGATSRLSATGVNPSGRSDPIWYRDYSPPTYAPLAEDAVADVCIVGAGIAGLTCAYLLARAGRSVIVLEGKEIAGGESGRTSAHLVSAIDDRFVEIERQHGQTGARLQYESHAAAIDLIESIASREQIRCGFKHVDGYLFPGSNDDAAFLEEELAAARRAGVKFVEQLMSCPADGAPGGPCLRFGRQARFQPLVFLGELAKRLDAMGVRLHCRSLVTDLATANGRVEAKLQNGFTVTANHGIAATNVPAPIGNWAGIYTKFAPYRSYMLGIEVVQGSESSIADALYWDNDDPYHYVRLERDRDRTSGDVLLVGGEDHKTGQHTSASEQEACYQRLETWARKHFKPLGDVVYRWSGQVNEPDDGVAFIGRVPTSNHENCYVITGDSGMGLTHGVLGAQLIADLIEGRESPYADLYRPDRKPLHAVGTFLSENMNAVAQYVDHFTSGDVSTVDDIAADCGAVIREGISKVAAYRDAGGSVHKCSAVCPHLKGIVAWNESEKSWDCPLHGSRFGPRGEVLHGPAVTDLKPKEPDHE